MQQEQRSMLQWKHQLKQMKKAEMQKHAADDAEASGTESENDRIVGNSDTISP